jgi:CBS domain containing-hemolysin-like protein
VSPPWRTSSRRSSARSATSTTRWRSPICAPRPDGRECWEADGSARLDQLTAIGLAAPDGPYETAAGLLATRLARIPAPGDAVEIAGWELRVLDVDHHRADRIRITAPARTAGRVHREEAR